MLHIFGMKKKTAALIFLPFLIIAWAVGSAITCIVKSSIANENIFLPVTVDAAPVSDDLFAVKLVYKL